MIEQIRICNFQSHKSTQLKFDLGVNVIVGSSDSGKTAIMRALFWVVQNRPLGNAFVSHWALNDKGKQIEPASVSVIVNGKKVKRSRSEDENIYQIDSQKSLEAIKTGVPPEVSNAFNLTEVNLQKQMDSPFLLSESAGEVARFFNRIIRLDIIDSFLSLVDGKKRKAKAGCSDAEAEVIQLKEDIETLDWIDKADRLILKAQRVEDKIEQTQESKDKLEGSVDQYEIHQTELLLIPDIKKAEKLLQEWSKIDSSKIKLSLVLQNITTSIERWTEASELIEKELPDLEKTQNLLNKLIEIRKEKDALEDSYEDIRETVTRWNILTKQTASVSDEIIRLESQLPERCPTCGKLLKEK